MGASEIRNQAGNDRGTRLVDVLVPEQALRVRNRVALVFCILMIAGFAGLIFWARMAASMSILLGVTLTVVFVALVAVGLGPAWAKHCCYRSAGVRDAEAIREHAADVARRTMWLWGFGFARHLARVLVDEGFCGTTVRLGTRGGQLMPAVPFDVGFEPRPLDDSNPSFTALLDSQPDGEGEEKQEGIQAAKPRRRLGVVQVLVLLLILGMVSQLRPWVRVYNGSITFQEGLVEAAGQMVALVPAALLCVWLLPGTQSARRQWLVVPGGLVRRTSGLFGDRWRLRVLVARDWLLCVHPTSIGKEPTWNAFVVRGDETHKLTLTNRETEVLLRAWLSPLSPPGEEQLSDLL